MRFDPQDYPLALQTPLRLTNMPFWQMHIPFAFALTQMLQPRLLVELGTHKGDSYCAFCQAVDTLGFDTNCYAVDTWAGDIHTGQYPDAIFDELRAYHDPRYGRFSTLIRSSFDDAIERFEDSSIDLLHIDGTHTYDEVRHDFESWLPKMSRQGVVIMHDVAEHRDDFGVWRLWAELKERYPHFEFPFGHGLGVVAVGDEVPSSMHAFFNHEEHHASTVHYFSMLGERIVALGETRELGVAHSEENAAPAASELQSSDDISKSSPPAPRLLAFYLPQFHPIPENDLWWGKGFTEWTNVAQAKPLFSGHQQPRIPSDLGFYDLRLPETREAQAELAEEYGIHGFCYHHYWFKGRRILDRPLDEVLASGRPDFPFCLCWANHHWTRRWDRRERERLIVQEYSEDDDRDHIRWLLSVFQDERYIRVDGHPLLLIWRAQDLPDALRTTTLWREEARHAGMPELYICNVETNEAEGEPYQYGCDAAVEFPPQRLSPPISRITGPEAAYHENQIREYKDLVSRFLESEEPSYRQFPTVIPSWDNTPRFKSGGASVYLGSTPEMYEHWLKGAIERISSAPSEEQLVFVNAWNEWAEGAYLEPDTEHGRAYLEATLRALRSSGVKVPEKMNTNEIGEENRTPVGALSIEDRYRHLLDKYTQLQQQIAEELSNEEESALPQRLRRHYESIESSYKELVERHKRLAERHKELLRRHRSSEAKHRGQDKKLEHDVDKMIRWLQQLDSNVTALFGSRRWKLAHALGEIHRRLLRKPCGKTAAHNIVHILREFHDWRRSHSQKGRNRR